MTRNELFAQLGTYISTKSLANNQTVVRFSFGEVLQSYDKTIGVYTDNGRWYFDPIFHDYSQTTSKYCKQWSGLSAESRRKACADPNNDRYQYVKLNWRANYEN